MVTPTRQDSPNTLSSKRSLPSTLRSSGISCANSNCATAVAQLEGLEQALAVEEIKQHLSDLDVEQKSDE